MHADLCQIESALGVPGDQFGARLLPRRSLIEAELGENREGSVTFNQGLTLALWA